MGKNIKPDRKYWTAQLLILAVISGLTLISAEFCILSLIVQVPTLSQHWCFGQFVVGLI